VQVGTLTARRVVDPACSTCAPIYRFADDYEVTVTGDDASRILATFTDSGARRVLQNGTVADTSTWKTVEFDGVAVRVPSSWPTEDLPSTLFHTTDAAGNVNGGGGMVDPGTCNGSLFGNTAQPTAYIGASDLTPSCAVELSWNISPRESVWIRAEASSPDAASGSSIARGSSNGLDVAVLGVDEAQHWSPDIALELVVRTAHDTVLVSLGVGTDASIARAVLHSLHATA
jgi:hypothetical protein